MEAFAGAFCPNRETGLSVHLSSLTQALAPNWPVIFRRSCSAVAMVQKVSHQCARDDRKDQTSPADSDIWVTWDGWLHNREDLADALGADRENGDPALVALAYQRWGDAFARYFIGDFALALWDPAKQQLVLSRDPFGVRPLFYCRADGMLLWASELRSLLPFVCADDIDESFIAFYITGTEAFEQTPYRSIRRLRPGTTLFADKERTRSLVYWDVEPKHRITYKADADYEERFRELFDEAVRCRLAGQPLVFAELSGGLDSSSIVCMADQIAARGEAPYVRTVSYTYEFSPTSDERTFISERRIFT